MKKSEQQIIVEAIQSHVTEASKSVKQGVQIAKAIFDNAKTQMVNGPLESSLLDKLNFHARNAPSPALRNQGSGLLLKHQELHGFSHNGERKGVAEAIESFVTESQDNGYAQAKKLRDELEAEVDKHAKVLQTYPKGEMGLTPDHVKNTPEFKQHKQNYNKAFEKLRTFNSSFTKKYKNQIRADRDARFNNKVTEGTHIHTRPDGTTLLTHDGDKDKLRGYIQRTPAYGYVAGLKNRDSSTLPDDDKTEYHAYAIHANQKDMAKLGSFKKHHHAVDAIQKFHRELEVN